MLWPGKGAEGQTERPKGLQLPIPASNEKLCLSRRLEQWAVNLGTRSQLIGIFPICFSPFLNPGPDLDEGRP